jgi:hypothetical protein
MHSEQSSFDVFCSIAEDLDLALRRLNLSMNISIAFRRSVRLQGVLAGISELDIVADRSPRLARFINCITWANL